MPSCCQRGYVERYSKLYHANLGVNKTRKDIAQLIGADDLIYQDLDDLTQACADAAPNGGVKEFEIGVFCGKYQTAIPEGYFDHLNTIRGKKRKIDNGEVLNGAITASSGPTNEARVNHSFRPELAINGLPANIDSASLLSASSAPRTPDNREDIRFVHHFLNM